MIASRSRSLVTQPKRRMVTSVNTQITQCNVVQSTEIDYSMVHSHTVLYNVLYQIKSYIPSEFIFYKCQIETNLATLTDALIEGYCDITNEGTRNNTSRCIQEFCEYIENLKSDINNKILLNQYDKLNDEQEQLFNLILNKFYKFLKIFYLFNEQFVISSNSDNVKRLKVLHKAITHEQSNIYKGEYTIVFETQLMIESKSPSLYNLIPWIGSSKSPKCVTDDVTNITGSLNNSNYGSCSSQDDNKIIDETLNDNQLNDDDNKIVSYGVRDRVSDCWSFVSRIFPDNSKKN